MEYVYFKDQFINRAEASVSLEDRGFKFGDGAFETIRVSKSKPYNLAFHLNRLKMGLAAIKIYYHDFNKLESLVFEIIKYNLIQDGFVRIYITRGEASFGYLPLPSAPNLYIQTSHLDNSKLENLVTEGAKLHISKYENISKNAIPRKYKLAQGLNSTLARLEAVENGCFESVMFNQEQYISDCSSSNIFLCMSDNSIITPDINSGALNGSIRNIILSNFANIYNISETQVTTADLADAKAVFITNVSWLLLEISEVPALGKYYEKSHIAREIKEFLLKDLEGIDA
jgi:branched-subunit amino acid aminotransferase/4-amino-4-deoxychorismate lyase